MQIHRINAWSDNYIFLLQKGNHAAVVDPTEAQPVVNKLNDLGADLIAIFNTHHHGDHVGGNRQLLVKYPKAMVYASEVDRGRIPEQQVFLNDGDMVTFCDRTAHIFFVPGHTRGHIAYYFPPVTNSQPGELFCGDTLFAGGCGRLFEGTPAQMVESLSKLRQLPDNTRVWCAHEYTLSNLKFAITVDAQNPDLEIRFQQVQTARQRKEATVPSLLGIEKKTNPFLRWDHPALKATAKQQDPTRVFGRIRGMKDMF